MIITNYLLIILSLLLCGCSGIPSESEVFTASSSSLIESDNTTINTEIIEFDPNEETEILDKTLICSILEPNDMFGGGVRVSYGNDDNGSVLDLDYAEWLTNSYVLTKEDGFYILLQNCYSNDWRTTTLIEYKDSGLFYIGDIPGGIDSREDVYNDSVIIRSRADVFSTYGFSQKYFYDTHMPESSYRDFNNIPDDTIWSDTEDFDEESLDYFSQIYAPDGRRILTLNHELQAFGKDKSNITIPAGDYIIPLGYDTELLDFYFEYDGKTYIFSYTLGNGETEYPKYINGVNEEDMFRVLPYAG